MDMKTMSDRKHSNTIITNESTLQRRDWIERAVSGVRSKASSDEITGGCSDKAARPALYIVGSQRAR